MAEPAVVDGAALMQGWPLRAPQEHSDKEERGTVLVVGGAPGTPGAVLLAGLAALRVGAGKLTVATTEATAAALAVEVPEAGVLGLPTTRTGGIKPGAADDLADAARSADAVLIGPGMADADAARDLVAALAGQLGPETVLVLDAMATTCGALSDPPPGWASRAVITPNRTEAARVLGHGEDGSAAESDDAVRLAETYGVTTVLGSHVADPSGSCWRIPKGNAGLGTSGSGDVLAGAVAGIAARSGHPPTAAMWGLSLHGAAGDRLARRIGPVGYLARELLDELPGCLRDLSLDAA
ncbi:MAG TPA: NAD(P)H-hydrate dehydratase [Mycobacteriales bacterium]|nr:NAD(P)H-hydrate dehydratase [Mycobacteriales bacterium]